MQNNAGKGLQHTVPAQPTSEERMALYDSMPPLLRQFVANAAYDYECRLLMEAWHGKRRQGWRLPQFIELCERSDEAMRLKNRWEN